MTFDSRNKNDCVQWGTIPLNRQQSSHKLYRLLLLKPPPPVWRSGPLTNGPVKYLQHLLRCDGAQYTILYFKRVGFSDDAECSQWQTEFYISSQFVTVCYFTDVNLMFDLVLGLKSVPVPL